MDNMDNIYVYCDGGCRGNQFDDNIGGWGVVLVYKEYVKEFYGNEVNTTNNKMELTSCIKALKVIKDKTIPIVVTMDSQYVIKGINEWIYGWLKKKWKTSTGKPVENKELWQELLDLKRQFNYIEFIQCRGHADNEGNIRADELANIAMDEISW